MIKTKAWNWNKVVSDYWNTASEDVYYYLHRWKELKYHNLLDLGCGRGRHSLLFAEYGFKVTGFDLSESGINALKEEARKNKFKIITKIGNITRLPFSDHKFNSILGYHSIYHVDSIGIKKVFAEIKRVLKKEGEIYFTMLSKTTYSYTAKECKKIDKNVRLKVEEDGTEILHYFVNYKDIIGLLKGFEIIKIRHIEDILKGKSSWHYFIHAKNK
jgi:ubiquinone/menaquinone biosynthesis C-methylase UbiE